MAIEKYNPLVRARLLFDKEIQIDRGGHNLLGVAELIKLIEMKAVVDREMIKTLQISLICVLILYLLGTNVTLTVPVWDITLSGIPGILSILVVYLAVSITLTITTFYNSQCYAQLIDSIVLKLSSDGVVDPDIIKAIHHKELLILKLFRKNFHLYTDVHITKKCPEQFLGSLLSVLMTLLLLIPILFPLIYLGFASWSLLPDTLLGLFAKLFASIAILYSTLLILMMQLSFKYDVADDSHSI